MLIKGKDVINLKVMTIREGKYVDDVSDIIYDPKSHGVRALLVDEGGWFSDAKVILFQDIRKIGHDAVMIESADLIRKAKDVSERVSHIAKDDTYLTKTRIITEDGTELGSVSDIYFDDKTGAVMEFEVSQGLMNIQSGKKSVKVQDIITIGRDATIVKAYTEQKFDEQGEHQGLKGMMNKTKDLTSQAERKIEQVAETTKEKYKETKDSPETQRKLDSIKEQAKEYAEIVKDKTAEVKDTTKQKTAEARYKIRDERKKEALGKYVKVNIITSEDRILARRGELVTHDIIYQAEQNGMLDQVLNNTSERPL